MRIMIVSPSYAPYSGVGSIRMVSLTKYLLKKQHKITVVKNAPELWPEDSLKSEVPEGIITVDVYAEGTFDDFAESYKTTIEKLYSNNEYDIAIYSCNPYYIAPAAVYMKKNYGAKYIIEFRDLWIKDEHVTRNVIKRLKKVLSRIPYRSREKEVIQNADSVVVVAPNDKKTLEKDFREHSDKINLIFNGYDDERIRLSTKTSCDYSFSYIGVFGKFGYYDYKYVLEMLKAVKEIRKKGLDLRIVHIGYLDTKTKSAIVKSGLDTAAYINTGFMDYAEGMDLLKKSIATCLIVHYKNALGTKLFDYMYVDRPIVHFSPKDSAIATILVESKNAFRCQSKTDAVKAISKIMKDGLTSLDSINRELYSRELQNDRYHELLRQVVGNEDEC